MSMHEPLVPGGPVSVDMMFEPGDMLICKNQSWAVLVISADRCSNSFTYLKLWGGGFNKPFRRSSLLREWRELCQIVRHRES